MKIKAFILTLALLAGIGTAYAQGDTAAVRPAAVSVTLDAGGLRNLDTYLSPLRYGGQHVRVGFERFRAARFRSECRVNQIAAGIGYDHLQNPAGNNTVHTLLADFDWRMMRRWDNVFVDGLRLYAGGGMGFDGGVAYNPRNSNNVCSPQIWLNAGVSGMAVYGVKLGRLPLTLRWQVAMPVAGVFFLPDYDQTFYEIYLGNYRDAINVGWWANRFDMENVLTVDLHFGAIALRVGYRNDFTTVWENNICVRRTAHSAVIGVAWESIRLAPGSRAIPENVRLISSYY